MTRSSGQLITRTRKKGVSLIEVGLCFLIVTMALAPLVKMVGGPVTAQGNSTRYNAVKNHTAILANSLAEQAMAGNMNQVRCGAAFNTGDPRTTPASNFPVDGATPTTYPLCVDNTTYNTQMNWQWRIYNPNDNTPADNQYYVGTLTVSDAAGGSNLVVPVRFFINTGTGQTTGGRTGLMISVDFSGSMAWSCKTASDASPAPPVADQCSDSVATWGGVAAPYMVNRYTDATQSGPVGAWDTLGGINMAAAPVTLNMWDDAQLDMVVGNSVNNGAEPPLSFDGTDPDPSTPNNETFPHSDAAYPTSASYLGNLATRTPPGSGLELTSVLGTGPCGSAPGPGWAADPYLRYSFMSQALGNGTARQAIYQLCKTHPYRFTMVSATGPHQARWRELVMGC